MKRSTLYYVSGMIVGFSIGVICVLTTMAVTA